MNEIYRSQNFTRNKAKGNPSPKTNNVGRNKTNSKCITSYDAVGTNAVFGDMLRLDKRLVLSESKSFFSNGCFLGGESTKHEPDSHKALYSWETSGDNSHLLPGYMVLRNIDHFLSAYFYKATTCIWQCQ
jgi:hypothetical protein